MKTRIIAAVAAAALVVGGATIVAAAPALAVTTSFTNPLATPDPSDLDITSLEADYTSTALTLTYHTQNLPAGGWAIGAYVLSRADLLTGAPTSGDSAYLVEGASPDGVTAPSYISEQYANSTGSTGSTAGVSVTRIDANTFTLVIPTAVLPSSGSAYLVGMAGDTTSDEVLAAAGTNGSDDPIGFGPLTRGPSATSTAITLTWPSQVHGSTPATVVATVSPATADGTVSLVENGAAVVSATVSNGLAILTLPTGYASGAHKLVAQFNPADPDNYTASQSGLISLKVISAAKATTTKVTLSKGSQRFKKKAVATVKVTVTGSPAGTITIYDGKKALKKIAVKTGKVSYKLSSGLKKGTHTIKASFTPKNVEAFKASTSKTAKLKVVK